ncbi:GNAT family N-acetyltransferase [Lutimaribacter sp. EGI FJ00015]|uniref:GNAT family N-acetyltransferase n=1 Tax=Lutimaribacter degradans TaxID=2945989 RepID=A0ACC5ZY19_9RHOB|nr:GNAT family N-acetyltransferase [Lutimaribacter sp. EGI FJ00013]MCM2563098.1 GNAT family N-acetyltransferase [Lutimaribacter sp. EGI FJ00013]MCO0614277.1 GNAT family N-acetyltransferase [Lutimaribacter sp. EGI FJ00015]MCO0637087.1 GNAT family N-acetyltransferase [Lutimaribacter sp. EGI FJ00014]
MPLTNAPTLETANLILRSHEARDIEPMIAFLTDQERAAGFGAYDNRHDAWRWVALSVGHWHIHGYGYFTIEDKASGQPAGFTGIWNPDGWPEPEIGWVVFDGFEGRGVAFEAAARARDWAYSDLGFTTLTSNIVPGNTRSVQLAERLGAWFERQYQNAYMGTEMLYRHPGPDMLDSDGGIEAYT